MSNNNNEMKKELGMGAAMATVVGCVIGSGVFFKPTAIYTATGGAPGLAIIAWVVTSLVCLCAAMTFAEIAILIPETGGMPVYLKKVFGDRVGYLCGWMQTVVFYPGLVAALAVAVAPGKAVPGRRHGCSCGNRMYHHHGCAELHGR